MVWFITQYPVFTIVTYIDGLVQERCNSNVLARAVTSTDFRNRLTVPPNSNRIRLTEWFALASLHPPMGPYVSTCSRAAIPHQDPPAYHCKLSRCWFQIKLVSRKYNGNLKSLHAVFLCIKTNL